MVIYIPPPPIMLTCERKIVNKFRAHSSITFTHISFWCPSLTPHQTTHPSSIVVRLKK